MAILKARGSTRGLSPTAAFIAAALAAFGGLVVLVHGNRTDGVDATVTMRIQRRQAPWFARLMRIVSWPGFPPESRILPLAIPAILGLLGYRVEALFQLLAWGTSAISGTVKQIMRRPRPNHPEITVAIARIGGTSFPSGHVINYIGVYGFLAFLANRSIRPAALRRATVGALSTLIALVGPSRIYLGHHWFSDVLASYLLGSSYLLFLTGLYRRVKGWSGR